MTASALDSPIVLTPKAEARVWGGRRLADDLGRTLPDGAIGESWELHGDLPVAAGPLAGRTLDSLVAEFGLDLLGSRGEGESRFPLLTKWLDCRDWLSVQVHPDDPLSQELTGQDWQRGKSEAWFVAEVDEGARLIHGLNAGVTAADLEAAEGDAMLDLLGYVQPARGELLFTAAGTVHALGPGFLIYEVQQSSDLTYRLYDWGRDRPIHPAQSLRCVNEAGPLPFEQDARGLRCRYFEIASRQGSGTLQVDADSFVIVAAVEGEWALSGAFGEHKLAYGDTVLLPAGLGEIRVAGTGRLLEIKLGDARA